MSTRRSTHVSEAMSADVGPCACCSCATLTIIRWCYGLPLVVGPGLLMGGGQALIFWHGRWIIIRSIGLIEAIMFTCTYTDLES